MSPFPDFLSRPVIAGSYEVDHTPDLVDEFEAEADVHERNGRHAEAGVLRDVVRRLRGEDEAKPDQGEVAEN